MAYSALRRPHQTKSEIGRAAADLRLAPAADEVSRAVLAAAEKRSAARDALGGAGLLRIYAFVWTARVVLGSIGLPQGTVVVGPITICTPLLDIASHIVDAVAV